MSEASFVLFDPDFLAHKAETGLPTFLQRKALSRLRAEFMAPPDLPLMRRYLGEIHKKCSFLDKRKSGGEIDVHSPSKTSATGLQEKQHKGGDSKDVAENKSIEVTSTTAAAAAIDTTTPTATSTVDDPKAVTAPVAVTDSSQKPAERKDSDKEDSVLITSPDVSTIFWQQIGFTRCEPLWDLTQFVQEVYKPSTSALIGGKSLTNLPINSDKSSSFSLLHSQTNHISAKTRFGSFNGREEDVNTYAASKRDVFIGHISMDVNTFKGRWRGGCSVLINTIYFFETYDLQALSILKRRLCDDLETSNDTAPIYPFMQVAMEMTRYIALAFEIITTANLALKHEEFLHSNAEGRMVTSYANSNPKFEVGYAPANHRDDIYKERPLTDKSIGFTTMHTLVEDQPVTGTCKGGYGGGGENVSIQQRDVVPEEKYMYSWRSYWSLITERDAIQRLFSIGIIIFENIFHRNKCQRLDCDEVFAATTKYLQQFIVHAKTIRQIEGIVVPYLDTMELPEISGRSDNAYN